MRNIKIGEYYYIYCKSKYRLGKILLTSNTSDYLVEFIDNINGHDGGGRGRQGHCLWTFKDYIRLDELTDEDKDIILVEVL